MISQATSAPRQAAPASSAQNIMIPSNGRTTFSPNCVCAVREEPTILLKAKRKFPYLIDVRRPKNLFRCLGPCQPSCCYGTFINVGKPLIVDKAVARQAPIANPPTPSCGECGGAPPASSNRANRRGWPGRRPAQCGFTKSSTMATA
jgi:hypothetical protein